MAYRMKKSWQEWIEGPKHKPLTRRDLLKGGLATGMMAMGLPKLFGGEFIKAAHADAVKCLPPQKSPGAVAHIFSGGGCTMGARFIGDQQASVMNATMAANYGIQGNLQKLGPGVWIDKTSAFGMVLLAGPAGFPGGPAGWQANVLSKIAGGAHLGPFNLDDGVGANSGILGTFSLDKSSQLGKDISFGGVVRAGWTGGTPMIRGGSNEQGLVTAVNLVPAAAGNTTAAELTNAASGAVGLAQALSASPGLKSASRKGRAAFIDSVGCSFYGNSALSDPNFGANLFTTENIGALSGSMTLASLTAAETAMLAALYQSATGVAGGVTITFNGRDYHSADPMNAQTNVVPAEIEDARTVVMFLAACHAAQQKGALIFNSNGNCIGGGAAQVTGMLNGTSTTMYAPNGRGDAGGHYNGGLMLFYSPTGSLPVAKYTGKLKSDSGDVVMDAAVGSYQNALVGLYLTAHKFVSGSAPSSLIQRAQKLGLAAHPDQLLLI